MFLFLFFFFLSPSCPRCLTQSERGHLLNVIMIIFSSRSVLLSVYYPQIFLILTSGSYL